MPSDVPPLTPVTFAWYVPSPRSTVGPNVTALLPPPCVNMTFAPVRGTATSASSRATSVTTATLPTATPVPESVTTDRPGEGGGASVGPSIRAGPSRGGADSDGGAPSAWPSRQRPSKHGSTE